MVEKCRGKVARALTMECPELRSDKEKVPRKLGVTVGTSGMISRVKGGEEGDAISRSSTFGRRERKSNKTAGVNEQNRKLNTRNDSRK